MILTFDLLSSEWQWRFVHRPVAGAVLPAINDRTEGVPHRWCTCLERSSLWRYVCPLAGRVFGRRLKTELFRRCYNAVWLLFFPLVVLEMDFLLRPL